MSEISFVLNGENVTLSDRNPTETLLDWLRENRGLKGTKEGCNEGDCGACTLMVSEHTDEGVEHRALNACILFLPQLNGKSVTTVEGLAGPDGEMHPVQSAMVDHHASQCGFCTPGIVMSLATAHQTEAQNHDDVLAGNLCRCTGYAPIIRAAKAAAGVAPPDWMNDNEAQFTAVQPRAATTFNGGYLPTSADELAGWYLAHPDATLIGGATDVGLWVTKQLRTLNNVAFISQINDLKQIDITAKEIRIGAAVTLSRLQEVMAEHHPDFAEMIRRFGSTQVRNAATIGGNIANGSPIGDGPPSLTEIMDTPVRQQRFIVNGRGDIIGRRQIKCCQDRHDTISGAYRGKVHRLDLAGSDFCGAKGDVQGSRRRWQVVDVTCLAGDMQRGGVMGQGLGHAHDPTSSTWVNFRSR